MSKLLFMVLSISRALASPNPDQDIQLNLARKIATPGSITIAIIDTGIDTKHAELRSSLWINSKEILNGKDDDGNGLIDDIHGWDYVRGSGSLSDRHGHGTHIAGIIHKVIPGAKLMVLRFYDESLSASETIRLTALAIRYATKMGAQIINYSGGGGSAHWEEISALREAQRKGILIVAAAGNESSDSDHRPYFPADYPVSNILSVAAHGANGSLIASSNFGLQTVDISAPGEKILSTLPGGFGEMSGTSQATAHATGVAALTWLKFPSLRRPELMIDHLKNTGRVEPTQIGRTQSGGRLNALGSLGKADRGMSANFQYFYDGNEIFTPSRSIATP